MRPLFLLSAITVLELLLGAAGAQAQTRQLWPEIDTYVGINDHMRFSFTAAKTRENGDTTDGEIGPSYDFYFRRLWKTMPIILPRSDQAASQRMMFRVGYHFLPSSDGSTTQRVFAEFTGRHSLKGGLVIADRNRVEANFASGDRYGRYRNRIAAERTLKIAGYQFVPYARAEFYYDSRYSKFSRTALDLGAIFPIRRRFEIEPYYEHQNDTSSSPNRQVNAVGLVFSIYFRSR